MVRRERTSSRAVGGSLGEPKECTEIPKFDVFSLYFVQLYFEAVKVEM